MRSPARVGLTAVLGTAGFALVSAMRSEWDPWWANAVVSALVIPLALLSLSDARRLLHPELRSVGLGLGLGVAMVALTHLGYRVATAWVPSLGTEVERLHAELRAPGHPLELTLILTVVIVCAEELLWRGAAVEAFEQRLGPWATGAAATGLYALPQLFGGDALLVVMALGVGAVFTGLRLWRRSLVTPLVAHAFWSGCIFVLFPVVRSGPA